MALEVIRQIIDPGRQQGNLHLGRPRIGISPAKRPDDLLLLLLRDRHRTPQNRRPCPLTAGDDRSESERVLEK